MLSFIFSGLRQRFGILLVASLVPLAAFGGLIAVDQLLPSAAESDSRTGFRWLMLVLRWASACHGFYGRYRPIFCRSNGSKIPRLATVFTAEFCTIRSLWVTMGWTLLVVFIFIGGYVAHWVAGVPRSCELVASTVQQAQEYGDGTRIAPERGRRSVRATGRF